ncbi:Uncharacterised protein [Arachnia propionica]|uniref:Uncharacterized protein n=1 Tax=Arachnia propionica TaxID=1750 RepID=A0A3S4UST0_9ACTN|nr:Uncharacterised protein [Arachnia propionica]
MFHTVFLGSRAIGGSEAWGYSGMGKIVGQEDKLFPFQIWFIWREDGLWRIEIRGFEGASIIPGTLTQPDGIVRTARQPDSRRAREGRSLP